MKLQTFRRFASPAYGLQAGEEDFSAGETEEEEVWATFSPDEALLVRVAASIRAAIERFGSGLSVEKIDGEEAVEGRVLTCLHQFQERDPGLLQKRKAKALRDSAALACEACGFDFFKHYGERGLGFIECHHVVALASLESEEKTRLDDLALLCSNCHRMVHIRRPWLTMAQLKLLVEQIPERQGQAGQLASAEHEGRRNL